MSPSPKYYHPPQPYLLDPRCNFHQDDDQGFFPVPMEICPSTLSTTICSSRSSSTEESFTNHHHYHHHDPYYYHHHPQQQQQQQQQQNQNQQHLTYYQHFVLPSDTIQGICIRYKISWRKLGQINGFFGKSLGMASKVLWIPKSITLSPSSVSSLDSGLRDSIVENNVQDQSSHEFMICYIMAKNDGMSYSDAERHCEMHNWDLKQMVESGLVYDNNNGNYGQAVENECKENHYCYRLNASDLLEQMIDRNSSWKMKLRTSLDALQETSISAENGKILVKKRKAVEIGIELKEISSNNGHYGFGKLSN